MRAALPLRVHKIGARNPVEDQGQFSSCTGNATTSALEIVLKTAPLSRMMAYYNGRALEHSTQVDDGASIRDVIKCVVRQGVAAETTWPYIPENISRGPDGHAIAEGLMLVPKIGAYKRITTLSGVKAALARKLPVVFGFMVPDYFQSDEMAKGWLRLPTLADPMIGGHAVVAVGYDAGVKDPYVLVRNSWGREWGLSGYFKMPEAWFTDKRRLVDDMWIVEAK